MRSNLLKKCLESKKEPPNKITFELSVIRFMRLILNLGKRVEADRRIVMKIMLSLCLRKNTLQEKRLGLNLLFAWLLRWIEIIFKFINSKIALRFKSLNPRWWIYYFLDPSYFLTFLFFHWLLFYQLKIVLK